MNLKPCDVERFWKKVVKGDDGHWMWAGSLNTSSSPQFRMWTGSKDTTMSGRRIAWELERGGIPTDRRIINVCGITRCVNPSHGKVVEVGEAVMSGRPLKRRVSPYMFAKLLGSMADRLEGDALSTFLSRIHEYNPKLTEIMGRDR